MFGFWFPPLNVGVGSSAGVRGEDMVILEYAIEITAAAHAARCDKGGSQP